MFLRQYHRTKDGTRHTYFALVEAQRTARGPRQRIVAPLGELTRDQQRCWRRTAIFHTRHKDGGELPLFVDGRPPAHPARTPLCRPRRDGLQQLPPTDRKDTPENVVKTSEKNRPPRYLQGRFARVTAQPGIALAQARALTVVTAEKQKPSKPRIPDVCEAFGIPWITLVEVFRREGWRV